MAGAASVSGSDSDTGETDSDGSDGSDDSDGSRSQRSASSSAAGGGHASRRRRGRESQREGDGDDGGGGARPAGRRAARAAAPALKGVFRAGGGREDPAEADGDVTAERARAAALDAGVRYPFLRLLLDSAIPRRGLASGGGGDGGLSGASGTAVSRRSTLGVGGGEAGALGGRDGAGWGILWVDAEDLGLDPQTCRPLMALVKSCWVDKSRKAPDGEVPWQSLDACSWQSSCTQANILPLLFAGGPDLFFMHRERLVPALEFIEGESLATDRVQKELVILQIGMQVAWALEHLHGEGVIHLDVNPSNILVRDQTELSTAGMNPDDLDSADGPKAIDFYGSTPKRSASTPGRVQHNRPTLRVHTYLADFSLCCRSRDAHTGTDAFGFKDVSRQPSLLGGCPQFWSPEQILEETTFWGDLTGPRDAPMRIEAAVTEAVDSWGWAMSMVRLLSMSRLLWDVGFAAFCEWLRSDESQERMPLGLGKLLADCLRIQPSSRPSCARIAHRMLELFRIQATAASYGVERKQPQMDAKDLTALARAQHHLCTQLMDKTDPQTRGATSSLAKALRMVGPFEEALMVTLDALEMKRMAISRGKMDASSGADAELARYLSAAGAAHAKLGNVDKAAEFYEEALRVYQRSMAPNHPSIAALLNNYAVLYEHLGQFEEAMSMHGRALKMRQEVLGEWSTDVAVSLNNLAILHRRVGNYQQAIPLYEKSLAIRQRSLGETHVAVAVSLNNLGQCYRHMGEPQKALKMHEQALHIFEQALGPEHPNVTAAINNLVAVLEALGKYDEALPLYQRRAA